MKLSGAGARPTLSVNVSAAVAARSAAGENSIPVSTSWDVSEFEGREGATQDPRVQETSLPPSPLPSMSRYLANCRLLHPNDSDVRIAWHRMHSRGTAVSLGISQPYHIQPLEKLR